jgi:hypothetical protein
MAGYRADSVLQTFLGGPFSDTRGAGLGKESGTVCAHLAMARVALSHHGGGLKGGVGDLSHGELLVVGLLGGDDGGVGGEHEVDAGVGHQVGLELSHIHVQRTIKAQGGSQGGDDLSDQPEPHPVHTLSSVLLDQLCCPMTAFALSRPNFNTRSCCPV